MARRDDLTVNWTLSPRIITVAAPSTEITVQDLHDTLHLIEQDVAQGLQYANLISSSGKEDLGGGVKVGVTAQLNNARVAFEGRSGPDWVLCVISGGNLVAINPSGSIIDVRAPTPFTSVDRAVSSSATLQEQDAIQFSSYDNRVVVDPVEGTAGTAFPQGTSRSPVNNMADAVTIAVSRGLRRISIIGTYVFDGTEDVSGYSLEGTQAGSTVLVMNAGTETDSTAVTACTVTGQMKCAYSFSECSLVSLNFTVPCSGSIVLRESGFRGTTSFQSGSTANYLFVGCISTEYGSSLPVINFNGAQGGILVSNWSGGVEWRGIRQGSPVSMDFVSGHCKIASDCSSGSVTVRGMAKLTDESHSTMTVDSTNLVQTVEPIEAVLRNKTITNPDTGIMTVYDTDGVTPLYTAPIYQDASGSVPYQGSGVERRERLQ